MREANKNMKNSSFFLESTESTETPDVLPSSQLIGWKVEILTYFK